MKVKDYMEKYRRIVEEKKRIYDKYGNELDNKMELKQCYDANDPARKVLKPYWFVSKCGELVSIYGKNPLWLSKNEIKTDVFHIAIA